MAMSRDMEAQGYILDGMARALYVHAYMAWTQHAPPPKNRTREVPDTVETRTASESAARQVVAGIASQSGLSGGAALGHKFLQADNRHWDTDPHSARWADRAYAFGSDLAMICLGTMDESAVPAARGLRLPSLQIKLDDEGRVLSWDGGY